MISFENNLTGRVIVVGLGPGDDVLDCINKAIRQHNIRQGAVVVGLGALSKAAWHRVPVFPDWETSSEVRTEMVTIEAPMELGGLQGVIAEGIPHVHMSVTDDQGRSHTGHLEPGTVIKYVGELVILEFEGEPYGRRENEYRNNLLGRV